MPYTLEQMLGSGVARPGPNSIMFDDAGQPIPGMDIYTAQRERRRRARTGRPMKGAIPAERPMRSTARQGRANRKAMMREARANKKYRMRQARANKAAMMRNARWQKKAMMRARRAGYGWSQAPAQQAFAASGVPPKLQPWAGPPAAPGQIIGGQISGPGALP